MAVPAPACPRPVGPLVTAAYHRPGSCCLRAQPGRCRWGNFLHLPWQRHRQERHEPEERSPRLPTAAPAALRRQRVHAQAAAQPSPHAGHRTAAPPAALHAGHRQTGAQAAHRDHRRHRREAEPPRSRLPHRTRRAAARAATHTGQPRQPASRPRGARARLPHRAARHSCHRTYLRAGRAPDRLDIPSRHRHRLHAAPGAAETEPYYIILTRFVWLR